jgi:hypothetical protein
MLDHCHRQPNAAISPPLNHLIVNTSLRCVPVRIATSGVLPRLSSSSPARPHHGVGSGEALQPCHRMWPMRGDRTVAASRACAMQAGLPGRTGSGPGCQVKTHATIWPLCMAGRRAPWAVSPGWIGPDTVRRFKNSFFQFI